jgi:3D (Asp-Asp-Asp) domain-containing protein
VRRSCRVSPPAAALTVLLAAIVSAPAAAVTGTSPGAREQAVVLQLYALDTRLDAAQRRLGSLDDEVVRLERERASLAAEVRAARRTLAGARRVLDAELRSLYEEPQPDALAVVLGASSFQDALDGVDDLQRASSATASVVAQATSASADVVRLGRALAREERALRSLRRGAEADLASLDRARAERTSFLAGLRERDRVAAEHRVRAVEARGRTAETRATTAPSLASIGAVAATGRTIVIVTTGYSLPGTTATGLPVAHGIAAVDPGVIPLGTRFSIPGYGEAVAADTGPAITGTRVDLWFPTQRAALAWGWRTLTVTLR